MLYNKPLTNKKLFEIHFKQLFFISFNRTFNIQHSTFNIQHSTFNIQHSTFNIPLT